MGEAWEWPPTLEIGLTQDGDASNLDREPHLSEPLSLRAVVETYVIWMSGASPALMPMVVKCAAHVVYN